MLQKITYGYRQASLRTNYGLSSFKACLKSRTWEKISLATKISPHKRLEKEYKLFLFDNQYNITM